MQDINHFSPVISQVALRQIPEESSLFKKTVSDFASPIASPTREFTSQEADYECCPNCSRKFFIGRLKLHLKSCKEGKAHKPVKAKAIPERATEESVVADVSKRMISQGNEPQENNKRSVDLDLSPIKPVKNDKNESECEEDSDDVADIVDLKDREKADDGRVGCSICERLFHVNRILKHEKACKKSSKKRPVFDTSKQRAIPEQGEAVKKTAPDTIKVKKIIQKEKPSLEVTTEEIPSKEQDSKKKANWKKQHENFIENIRFNRKLKQMEANGEDTSNLVAPTIVNDSYVSCSYCFRKFAPATAERHIPKCKDIFNRPKPPKNLRLEKLEECKVKLVVKKQIQKTEGGDTSPKEKEEMAQPVSLKTEHGKFIIKQAPSSESKRKRILPSIKNPENAENVNNGYEINLTPQKLRSYRSQSPVANREMKKVFTEPMPKKEDLLQNYQSLLARAGHYATEACPYCQRKFGFHAAERHVPVCKELHSRIRGKKSDGQAVFEDKKKQQMYLTSFAAKIGFANKLLENDDTLYPRSTHNASTSTNYKPFFAGKKPQNSERHLLPIKKSQKDSKESLVTKPNLLQKPKLVPGPAHFCTSCGTKFAKVHNFCGQCGHKKDAIYIA